MVLIRLLRRRRTPHMHADFESLVVPSLESLHNAFFIILLVR